MLDDCAPSPLPETRTSYRRLSLPTFLLKELEVWRLACPHGPYDLIFPNLDGQPMSHSNLMQLGFFPALQRAGIRRIRFHDLRHTFASLMIGNGEDIVRVSRLMGHATASFTLSTATCSRASTIRAAIGSHPWFLETKWKLLPICQLSSSGRAQKTLANQPS